MASSDQDPPRVQRHPEPTPAPEVPPDPRPWHRLPQLLPIRIACVSSSPPPTCPPQLQLCHRPHPPTPGRFHNLPLDLQNIPRLPDFSSHRRHAYRQQLPAAAPQTTGLRASPDYLTLFPNLREPGGVEPGGVRFRVSGGPQEVAPPGVLAGAGGSAAGGGASFSSNRPLVLFSVGLLQEDELYLVARQLGSEKGRRQEGGHDRSPGFYKQVSEGPAWGHWSHCPTVSDVGGAPTRGRGYQGARS